MITILPSAREDLANGADFYESQKEGLGGYFLETLFVEIDSLNRYAGIHSVRLSQTTLEAISLRDLLPNRQRLHRC